LRAHSRGELMRGKEVKKGSLGRSPSLPFGPLGAQTIQKGCADRDGMEITRTLSGARILNAAGSSMAGTYGGSV
jgi:hypothetical protein